VTKKYTFYLYISQSIFCLIKKYEIILGRGSAVPERLRNTDLVDRTQITISMKLDDNIKYVTT
jgi:hypothetical protein